LDFLDWKRRRECKIEERYSLSFGDLKTEAENLMEETIRFKITLVMIKPVNPESDFTLKNSRQ